MDATPRPLFVTGYIFSLSWLWLALFGFGARETGTDKEEAVAAYREALKENTRERVCTLHIDATAALAGCSSTSVKNALRQAACSVWFSRRNAASQACQVSRHRLDYLEGMDRLAKLG